LGLCSLWFYNYFRQYFAEENYSHSELFAGIIFVFISWLIYTTYLIIVMIIQSFSGYQTSCRYFAPFYFGSDKLKKPIMDMLFKSMEDVTLLHNFDTVKINFDSKDSMSEYYPYQCKRKSSIGFYMAKSINPANNLGTGENISQKDVFFDPRDF